ncbi:hypothetical protein DEU56DRAFT_779674 [Suillus clintonianus]|uniref:uncharacterized protein n=1 Tax=Suillus clintonianus TaxID=1904413 RepID=UPI001B860E4E|nr:uncharacterized protein DEU56DRAFT_779674 [Suillus clintonianus]KAG2150377.1 hypothetical protein DEU56DRAFT_779674 [Suillus clintonianus]
MRHHHTTLRYNMSAILLCSRSLAAVLREYHCTSSSSWMRLRENAVPDSWNLVGDVLLHMSTKHELRVVEGVCACASIHKWCRKRK